MSGVTVTDGDVLFTGDSVARCCRAPAEILPARVNQHVSIIRPRSLPIHRDIDPALMMRPQFADPIRASSPPGLHQQARHMTGSDLCAARQMISCQAGAIHTWGLLCCDCSQPVLMLWTAP